MNNIVFLAFCLFILSTSPYANGEETDPCFDYIQDSPDSITETELSEEIPYRSGLLWKIEKDGKMSYLFGTMHSQDRLISSLPPPVRLAMAKSQQIIMESAPDNNANQIFNSLIYFDKSTNSKLEQQLPEPVFQRLVGIIKYYKLENLDLSRLKPWAVFTLIGRPKPVNAATQDMSIYQFAQQLNKNISSLESMQDILGYLDKIDLNDQVEILTDTVCNHAKIIADTRILVELYMNRDLAGIYTFNNQPHHDEAVFNRFIQIMIYDRNRYMLERMKPYLETGDIFISVGASHLIGKKGLLNELSILGYTLSKIY